MIKRFALGGLLTLLMASCYRPERNCQDFKTGKFSFTTTVDGEEMTTTFVRNDTMEIDYFEGKRDTSSIRWINDCEYIVKKLNPRNQAEKKSVSMKILSTTDDSYTFEYGLVGQDKKSRGMAVRKD